MDLSRRVNTDPRRALPSIHRLTRELVAENPEIPAWAAAEAVQQVVASAREALEAASSAPDTENSTPGGDEDWLAQATRLARKLARPQPQRVINATGVVLHTNLGRAPLAPGAAEAAARAAASYTDLELDLDRGRRGDRLAAACARLSLSTGAEAAYAASGLSGTKYLTLAKDAALASSSFSTAAAHCAFASTSSSFVRSCMPASSLAKDAALTSSSSLTAAAHCAFASACSSFV